MISLEAVLHEMQDSWELAFTLLDKLGEGIFDIVCKLGISIHPS